jgi:hypothetical protein
MKYLIFLPITLLSFGVAFGGNDYVAMATDGDSSSDTSASGDVTVVSWGATKSDKSSAGFASTSDKNDQSSTASKKTERHQRLILDSTSDGSNDIGTDYSCASGPGCPR